jgi:hypothetical protein
MGPWYYIGSPKLTDFAFKAATSGLARPPRGDFLPV